MKVLVLCLSVFLSLYGWASPPGELRNNFVDIGSAFGELDFTDSSDDVDVYELSVGGSVEAAPFIAFWGELRAGIEEYEDEGLADDDLEYSTIKIAVRPIIPVTRKFQIVFPIGFIREDIEQGSFEDDDTGRLFGLRLRGMPNSFLEIEGGVTRYDDLFNGDREEYQLGLRIHVSELFSMSGILEKEKFLDGGADIETAGFNARFSF